MKHNEEVEQSIDLPGLAVEMMVLSVSMAVSYQFLFLRYYHDHCTLFYLRKH